MAKFNYNNIVKLFSDNKNQCIIEKMEFSAWVCNGVIAIKMPASWADLIIANRTASNARISEGMQIDKLVNDARKTSEDASIMPFIYTGIENKPVQLFKTNNGNIGAIDAKFLDNKLIGNIETIQANKATAPVIVTTSEALECLICPINLQKDLRELF